MRSPKRYRLPSKHSPTAETDRGYWTRVLGAIVPVITIGGLVVYALLTLIYNQFYDALGVSPSDVGLGYTATLAGSAGLSIAILSLSVVVAMLSSMLSASGINPLPPIAALVLASIIASTQTGWRLWLLHSSFLILIFVVFFPPSRLRRNQRLQEAQRGELLPTPQFLALVRPVFLRQTPTILFAAIVLLGVGGTIDATRASRAAIDGKPVLPAQIGPLQLMELRAIPVRVKPIGDAAKASSWEGLDSAPLLYLGQANGSVVVYDSQADRAFLLPAGSVLVNIENCIKEKAERQPCNRVFEYGYRLPRIRFPWQR
jgi:hypothetical protein